MTERVSDAGPIAVVAAVVCRDGRYLLGRRPAEKRHGSLWEFPGGKVDEGESPLEAVRRELAEELRVEVTGLGRRLGSIGDGASRFVIEFHEVEMRGRPSALEHSAVGWFTVEELAEMSLAPADEAFVDGLRRTDRDAASAS